jgi:mRNA-degrading endonuclease RelE of RelBE toxin-antitoxin system
MEFKKTAVKDLKKLPPEIIKKLNNAIAALSENPLPFGI